MKYCKPKKIRVLKRIFDEVLGNRRRRGEKRRSHDRVNSARIALARVV